EIFLVKFYIRYRYSACIFYTFFRHVFSVKNGQVAHMVSNLRILICKKCRFDTFIASFADLWLMLPHRTAGMKADFSDQNFPCRPPGTPVMATINGNDPFRRQHPCQQILAVGKTVAGTVAEVQGRG